MENDYNFAVASRRIHHLKIDEEFADPVARGEKTFEIRFNDRGFQKGEFIIFKAVSKKKSEKIVHWINFETYEITYVLNGWGLKNGYVALGIRKTKSYIDKEYEDENEEEEEECEKE